MSEANNQKKRQEPDHGDFCRSNVAFMLNVMRSQWKALTCIFKKICLCSSGRWGGVMEDGGKEWGSANRGYCDSTGEKWWCLGLG